MVTDMATVKVSETESKRTGTHLSVPASTALGVRDNVSMGVPPLSVGATPQEGDIYHAPPDEEVSASAWQAIGTESVLDMQFTAWVLRLVK